MIKTPRTVTSHLCTWAAATTLLGFFGAAQAIVATSFVDIDLSGWQATAAFGEAGNSELTLQLGTGLQITGYDYLDLRFTSQGASFRSEFTLSINDSTATGYMDWAPSDQLSPGSVGPVSGAWGSAQGAGIGAPFALNDNQGTLWVTVYEGLDDDGVDAVVGAGTLRVYFVPVVPEPSTYALMAVGLLGVAAATRRRQGR